MTADKNGSSKYHAYPLCRLGQAFDDDAAGGGAAEQYAAGAARGVAALPRRAGRHAD